MKKAEKSAGASRAKNDKADKGKGAKGKAAAPAPAAKKAPAKKPDAKESKAAKAVKEDPKAKAKKAPAKVEARAEARAEAKTPAKAEPKGKGKGKSKGAAEIAEAAAVAHDAGVEADTAVTQRILALPDMEADGGARRPGNPAKNDDGADRDDDAGSAAVAPAEPLSEEERELSSLYQGELDSPSLAHGEFKDQKTADEDRPMLPEINARDERRRSWEDRRDRRRQEREQRRQARRDGHRGGGQQQGQERNGNGAHRPQLHSGNPPREQRSDQPRGDQPREQRNEGRNEGRNDGQRFSERNGQQQAPQSAPAPAAAASAPATSQPAAVATSGAVPEVSFGHAMATATATLFQQLRNAQPLPVKQLAAMLRKRNLIEGEPDVVWPQLRAELLSDERAFRSLGLRPRVVHRGRDLFAPGPAVVEGENELVASVATIQSATARGLSAWLAQASPAAFERMVHAYLLAVGYRDINWVKRVDGIAYAQATAPGIERSVLVSARAGNTQLDRRSVGELRVGVEAKNLPFGTLFAAAPSLSSDAERELERAGRSIGVVCGESLVTALMAAGIGVAATAVTVRFLDEQFLEDLSVG